MVSPVPLEDQKMFATLNGTIEIALRSNKPKTAALVKQPIKKGVEKAVEEHHQWATQLQQIITEQDNQIHPSYTA